ncbi:MAG: formate dehydrogenase accessory sulfurtransferase FdhD, partial [Syntrophomonadaceae bacterium]|nr:formate dehydrogenase accessory sulfurtransferase FdhD [Syntrophomonadaceae bacterium]
MSYCMEREASGRRAKARSIWRYSEQEGWQAVEDLLVDEFAATIHLNGQELVTLLCTPEYLEDLAVGFLAGEGLLPGPADLEAVSADYRQGQVWVSGRVRPPAEDKSFMKRYLTTGCGKGTTFFNREQAAPLKQSLRIGPGEIEGLMRCFQERSELFRQTGGVHSVALCRGREIILYREDLGRHNALDKVIGHAWRQGIDLGGCFLVTSGRVSSEMLLKTVRVGIQLLISRAAATSLAVELAEQLGATVVGFARGGRFNVYCHPGRIAGF